MNSEMPTARVCVFYVLSILSFLNVHSHLSQDPDLSAYFVMCVRSCIFPIVFIYCLYVYFMHNGCSLSIIMVPHQIPLW